MKNINLKFLNYKKILELIPNSFVFFKKYTKFFKNVDFKLIINKKVITLIISSIFFLFVLFLSIPGLYDLGRVQKVLTEAINKEINLDISLTPDIEYRIFPQPYFHVKDAKIFNNNKSGVNSEIAEIKNLKIYIKISNFFNKDNIHIKKIGISDANFFIKNDTIKFIRLFFTQKFPQKNLFIKKSKLFFNDDEDKTLFIYTINKSNFQNLTKNKSQKFVSNGEFFNLPAKFEWEKNTDSKSIILKLNLSKISVSFLNKIEIKNGKYEYENNLRVLTNEFKTKYNFEENSIKLYSNSSFIKNIPLTYNGSINIKPFYFDINFKPKKFDLSYFLKNTNFFNELFLNKILIHENLNGLINIKSENLVKAKVFEKIDLFINFKEGSLSLDNTSLSSKKIGDIVIEEGNFVENENSIFLLGKILFKVNNLKEFQKYFLIPKNLRKDFKEIEINFSLNTSNDEFKIYNIFFYDLNKKKIESKNIGEFLTNNTINKKDILSPIFFRNFLIQVFSNYFVG